MNKRALKMQNEMLAKQVASLSSQINGYKKRMEEYSLLLQARDFEINRLNGELQTAQSGRKIIQQDAAVQSQTQQEPANLPKETPIQDGSTIAKASPDIAPDLQQPPLQMPPQDNIESITAPSVEYANLNAGELLDSRQKLAAETIAAITLKAAALDAFLQKSNDPNAKELQAMVLGKTELFKSQVFAVVKGGVDGAGFVASLETLKSQMIEYFENIKMQLRT